MLLALKLLLVPSLLAVISLAGRRWGPGVAGWLAGFPSLTGPILFFLALERGPGFTAQAAVLCLACVFPAITFGVAYAWASRRYGWPLHVIEECADDPVMEQPERFLEALNQREGTTPPTRA